MPERARLVATAVVAAVVVNLLVYGAGRLAGGTFEFTTAAGDPAEVDAATVSGFTAVPLLAGLLLVAALQRFGTWVTRAALVIGPLLAVATIALMTLPADLDRTSTLALSTCHLTLIPILTTTVRRMGARRALGPTVPETRAGV